MGKRKMMLKDEHEKKEKEKEKEYMRKVRGKERRGEDLIKKFKREKSSIVTDECEILLSVSVVMFH